MTRDLLPYQQRITNKILTSDNNRWGLFFEMGLGKTLTSLFIAAERIKSYKTHDHVFIFCPASLQTNWKNEIEIDNLLSENEFTIFPYSMVSLKKVQGLKITSNSIVILDESHFIKNPSSKRSKFFINLLKKINPYIISLTGTPDPRCILDLWIQCYLLNAWTGNLPLNFFSFQYTYANWVQLPHFRKMTGEKNREYLLKGFDGKAFFLRKKDVIDLPDKIYEKRFYELTSEQKKYLKELKKDALSQTELTGDYIMASMHNFLSVCSGFVNVKFDEAGNQYPEPKTIRLKKNPKLDLFEDILLSMDNQQVIVFCGRREEVFIIEDLIKNLKLTYSIRIGGSSENEKSLNDFIENKTQILIATVQSSSTGLNIVNCSTMIYFSNIHDLMHRVQSEDRMHRYGQIKNCLYLDLIAKDAPDALLLESLKSKKNNMEETFRLFLNKI